VKNRIKIQSTGDPKNTKQTHLIQRNKESNTAIKNTATADYNNNNAQHSSKQTNNSKKIRQQSISSRNTPEEEVTYLGIARTAETAE
jgi:hypothetical protein